MVVLKKHLILYFIKNDITICHGHEFCELLSLMLDAFSSDCQLSIYAHPLHVHSLAGLLINVLKWNVSPSKGVKTLVFMISRLYIQNCFYQALRISIYFFHCT
jgi:hypothetical protein